LTGCMQERDGLKLGAPQEARQKSPCGIKADLVVE
jgi:hypothetical protein